MRASILELIRGRMRARARRSALATMRHALVDNSSRSPTPHLVPGNIPSEMPPTSSPAELPAREAHLLPPSTNSAPEELLAEWLADSELPGWDEFVASHRLGSLYHTSAWRAVLREAFPHIQPRVLALREKASRRVVGGTLVGIVRSWLLGRRIVVVPFASYVDPIVSSREQLSALITALRDIRSDCRANIIELRLLRVDAPGPGDAVIDRHIKHHRLDLSRGVDAILRNASRSCVRQWVNKADKAGVAVRAGASPTDWENFFELYLETRRRLALPVMPRRFFRSLERHVPASGRHLLLAEKDGTVLGAGLGLMFNGVYLLEWVGDSALGRTVGANQRLYWAAIQYAAQTGCHTFSFGRTAATNTGLLDYKRRWGATEEDMTVLLVGADPREFDPDAKPEKRFSHRLSKAVIQKSPPWFYLRFSEFCYRHLG